MKSSKKTIIGGAAAVAVYLLVSSVLFVYWIMPHTVMTKCSPDGKHSAMLARAEGIDLNFRVYVDSQKVYHSADFAPRDADFREQIAWSIDCQSVVVMVAESRLFGYHVNENGR